MGAGALFLLGFSLNEQGAWGFGGERAASFVLVWALLVFAWRGLSGNTSFATWRAAFFALIWAFPLCLFSREMWDFARAYTAQIGPSGARFGSMALSLWWSVYGAVTLFFGMRAKRKNVRLAGLALLCVTFGKVFLLDLSFLDGALRVLSLAGLGVTLLFVSWLYSRFVARETA